MAIRVTQLFVQYAADPTTESDVRVTRVFAQVAVQATEVSTASDTLNFVESAHDGIHGQATDIWAPLTEEVVGGVASTETATDTLTYTEQAILDLARASDDLTYTETASAASSEYTATASDTWSLSESADDVAFSEDTWTITEEAIELSTSEDTWTIAENVQVSAEYNVTVTDTWSLIDVVGVQAEYNTTIEDDLDEFTEVYDPDTNTITTVQVGGYTEEATSGGPFTGVASDALFFTEINNGWVIPPDGPGVYSESASDTWSITETARALDEGDSTDTVTYTESATGDVGPTATDTLEYTESAVSALDSVASATDTWSISEAISYVLEGTDGVECQYTPFVGTDTDPDAPTPPPLQYSPAKEASGFKLQYPSTGAITDEVVLPNPSFGNQDKLEFSRVLNETRGGKLIVFADPTWPRSHTRQFAFENMTEAQASALLTFMETYPGLNIRLIDQEGREWIGIITQPNDPIVQDGKGCRWTASFEFRGERTDTIGANDDLDYVETSEGTL